MVLLKLRDLYMQILTSWPSNFLTDVTSNGLTATF